MKVLDVIKAARAGFAHLSFASLDHLWQCAHELKNFGIIVSACRQLERQNQVEFAAFIQNCAEIDSAFDCKAQTYGKAGNRGKITQTCFASSFQLIEQAKAAFDQGMIVVCDDLSLWQHLQYAVMGQAYLPYDWLAKLYLYINNKNLINTFNMLNHSFLKQDDLAFAQTVEKFEYRVRKKKDQDFHFENSLATQLLNITRIEDLPPALKAQLGHAFDYTDLLDGASDCLEWYKMAVNLSTFTPQIRLGLHQVLQFKPEQVVSCLKYRQLRPLQSQMCLAKSTWQDLKIRDSDYLTRLKLWAQDATLNIFAYSQNATFEHPLIEQSLAAIRANQIKVMTQLPVANPPLSSRPTSISASGFNHLMQDPYGYYASYVLKLKPLESIGINNFAKEFGICVHKLVEIYLKQEVNQGVNQGVGKEQKIALQYIADLELSSPKILWHGRLLRILEWVQKQFAELKPLKIEGEKELQTLLAGTIVLKARIDAWIFTSAGNLVVNFKTGAPPHKIEVTSGYAPQLIIEMFVCQNVHQKASGQVDVTQGEFWQLMGTQPPGLISFNLALPLETMRENLEKITSHYLTAYKPFLACPWPLKKPKYNEYRYLERLTNE